jgi:hypothetical protein
MAEQLRPDDRETLSPQDVHEWAAQEVLDSGKAHELRVREATTLASDYSQGKISGEEAMERLRQFDRRWGEALFGASANTGMSDDEILAKIDETRASSSRPRIQSARHDIRRPPETTR